MSDEKQANRSSAPSADVIAQVNTASANDAAAIAASVAAATAKAIFDQLAPFLKDAALTPEKLMALKAPYVDPKMAARELRESLAGKDQEAETMRLIAHRKEHCPHKYIDGKAAICLLHNNLDNQVRGVCMLCHDVIHPREWVIDAPDPITGKAKSHIRPAHKNYDMVGVVASFS
jgi:hypothetical protein